MQTKVHTTTANLKSLYVKIELRAECQGRSLSDRHPIPLLSLTYQLHF